MINEWNNRQKTIADVISLIKVNGYYPCIVEDRKALTRILAMCKHNKIANFEYNIVDIQRIGKKKWKWDQSTEYWIAISGDFIEDFCEYCINERDNKKKKNGDEMTETIWIYDAKESEDISYDVLDDYEFTDEEREMYEKEDKEYLESLPEEERKRIENPTSSINWEEWEREKEERNRKYDGGTVIETKFLDIDNGFNEEIHKFTAVLKDGKIGIFYPDLFCDYLRNEDELDIFFKNIDIMSHHIEGDTRKIEYSRNVEHVHVRFAVEEIINNRHVTLSFSDGQWFSYHWKNEGKFGWTLKDDQIIGWGLDISEWNRDLIIKEITEYDNKFVPISKELIIEKMQDKINRINSIWEDFKNKKISKKAWRKHIHSEANEICYQIRKYSICDQCRNFKTCEMSLWHS